jgi:hypothetical protein
MTTFTTGSENVAVGSQALYDMVTGSRNIAIGKNAAANFTNANNNVAIGTYAAQNETTSNNFYLDNIFTGATTLRATVAADRSASLMYGTFNITGSLQTLRLNATTTISEAMQLEKQAVLPTGTTGSLAVSGSNLFFHNGTAWSQVI